MATASQKTLFYQIPTRERLGPYTTLRGAAEVLNISEIKLTRLLKKLKIEPGRFGWVYALHRDKVEELERVLTSESTSDN